MRLRLDLAYDGTGFAGWAVQPGLRTVQGVLEDALGTVLRTDGPPRVTVAGRTDSGVHARGQVAHVDIPAGLHREVARPVARDRSTRCCSPGSAASCRRTSSCTPLTRAPEGFDARFSALRRRYTYRICDDAARRDPLSRTHVLWHRRALDVDAMAAAARPLVGSPRLRVVLQAAAGGDDDPHARGVRVVPAGRRAGRRARRRDGAGRRVLPLDGAARSSARAWRWGRGGADRAGRPSCSPPGAAVRACTWSPRTGSRSRRWATRPTRSWPRGRCRPGRDGRPRTCSTAGAAAAAERVRPRRLSVGVTSAPLSLAALQVSPRRRRGTGGRRRTPPR